MNQPKNQHWVPQFYLRHFATTESFQIGEPQVWIFSTDEADGEERLTNIKNICTKNYLYSPVDKAGKRNWALEARLQQLESKAARFWKYIADDFIDLGDDSIRKGVALFVAIMYLRHPDILKGGITLYQKMVQLFEQAPKRIDGTPDVEEIEINGKVHKIDTSGWLEYCSWGKNEHQQFFADVVKSKPINIAKSLMKKRWSILFTEIPKFITSDKPVAIEHATKQTFGFGTKGIIVSFPLSPTRLLIMDDLHKEPANQYYPLKESDVGAAHYKIWHGSRFMVTGRQVKLVLREICSWADTWEEGNE